MTMDTVDYYGPHSTKEHFLEWGYAQRFNSEKEKTPIWFEPMQGKFLFMDVWQEWDVYDMLKKGQLRFIKKALHQGDWMLQFHYVHIEYEKEIYVGKKGLVEDARLVLYRKKSDKIVSSFPCPFCYNKHIHGTMDGHRVAHCPSYRRETVTALDGTILRRDDGYYVRYIELSDY